MRKYSLFAFGLMSLALISCGGGSGNNAPNIAGDYLCTAGCIGDCDFATNFSITQDGSKIIVETDSESFIGSVDEDGNVNYSSDQGNCDGLLIQGTAVLNCKLNGVDCQQVTYKRQ